ncbi:MAG TPA: flagellar hook protein FlgE [Longimicrobiaceae bacterium]|nr:flagellar hook protein FlgE [Longimicrobiaceae bacterium]
MRSLFSGVSGLRNHQIRMDVIGNNVANVNTVAFKAGRVTFKEGFAQLLRGASAPQGEQGGINPAQIGLGMEVGSVDTLFNQGNLESTGNNTDLAIQGDAFFVVAKGDQRFYTRAGNFVLDAEGRLVSGTNGMRVQGRMATEGVLGQTIEDITLPTGQTTPASASTMATIGGNLDASAAVGAEVSTSITVYDSLGDEHELKIDFTKTAANQWSWTVDNTSLGTPPPAVTNGTGVLDFDGSGNLTTAVPLPTMSWTPTNGADAFSVDLNLGAGSSAGLTQFAGASNAVLKDQDGYTAGSLQSFVIDPTGTITGAFSNGTSLVLGQIAIADFNNPGGLVRAGDNMYNISPNSGDPMVGFASADSESSIASGVLEMSNVDLTQEFTSMIIAQRGFQANGRVITSADEMLQEVVNLKR